MPMIHDPVYVIPCKMTGLTE